MNRQYTGLVKVCPRCGRRGVVWLDTSTMSFVIDVAPGTTNGTNPRGSEGST